MKSKRGMRIAALLVAALAVGGLSACRQAALTSSVPLAAEATAPAPTATLTYLNLPTITPTPAPREGEGILTESTAGSDGAAPTTLLPESPTVVATPASTSYTVQPGDTLLALAMHYGLPMAAIQLANQMGGSTTLYAGQTLEIPAADAWRGASPFWTVYEVQSGDTVIDIAQQFGLDFVALVAVNELTDADVLHVGQALVLPLDVPIEVAAAPVATPPVVAAAASAATPAPVAVDTPVAAVTPIAAPPAVSTAPAEIAGWPAEVFARINAERAAAGLGPFTWNDTLAQAAYLHGLDCQQRGSCNHTGSDGSTVKMRVLRAGYPAVGAAECIVYSQTPQQAVFWWMDEVPPNDWHRRTILSTWVTEIGIAVVPNHLGSYYFIADFGRPQ
ncbi:MAG TPA: LysM peptidoglycan-binding domain-containing protein [Anaerolineae bacterium]|nr:LysM peptidoglycan-binding domain-containing protein [Anaerolineae bacterium]